MDADLDSRYRHVTRPVSTDEVTLQLVVLQSALFFENESVCLSRFVGLAESAVRATGSRSAAHPIGFSLELIWTDFMEVSFSPHSKSLKYSTKSPPPSLDSVQFGQ